MTLIPQPLVVTFNQQNAATQVRSGLTTAVNNIGSGAGSQVLARDSQRNKITFINPGDVDILVYQTVDVNGVTLAPTFAAPGGGMLVFANGGSVILEGVAICQTPFGAIARSGSNKSLTIITQPTGT